MITINDILGNIVQTGDTIVWNPPKYKGLIYGICVGFSSAGLPLIKLEGTQKELFSGAVRGDGFITPKTGFIIGKKH